MLITIDNKPAYVKWAGVEHRDDDVCSAVVGISVTANHITEKYIVVPREVVEQGLRLLGRHAVLARMRIRWDKAGVTLAQGITIPVATAGAPIVPTAKNGSILIKVEPHWLRQGGSGPQCQDRPVLRALLGKVLELKRLPEDPKEDWVVQAVSISQALQASSAANYAWHNFRTKHGIKNSTGIRLATVCAELVPDEPKEE